MPQIGTKYLQNTYLKKQIASRILYKELLKLNNMKITQFVKWVSDVNKHFTKEHMVKALTQEKHSTPLISQGNPN